MAGGIARTWLSMPARVAGIAALCALVLGGCAADQLSELTANGLSDEAASGSSASGGAYALSGEAKKKPFNPFGELNGSSSTSGARQVIEKPTFEEVMKAGPLEERWLGRADAPVTVVKYASLTCPYCRKFQREVFPQLKRNYIDTGKVRFIIREFPIGRSSGNATIALRCAPKAKYFTLYSKFLDQQSRWVSQEVRLDNIHKVASQVGLSRSEFDACLKNQDLITGLQWVKDRGRTLGIIGTPNFFIQEERVKKVLTYEELKARIEAKLAQQRMAVAN